MAIGARAALLSRFGRQATQIGGTNGTYRIYETYMFGGTGRRSSQLLN